MKNRINAKLLNTFKYKSYIDEYNSIPIKNAKDFTDAVPQSLKAIPDTTEDSRSYAYGQGSSIFVKIAERKKLECFNTNI